MRKFFLRPSFFLLVGLVSGVILSLKLLLPSGYTRQESLDREDKFRAGFSLEEQTIRVAKKVGEAVVSITTETREGGGYYSFPFSDDFVRRFFEEFFGPLPEEEYKRIGLGSGVIIDKRGYILTNEHVIGRADKIRVTLADGREFEAKVKGKDRRSDLGVIKIEAKNLPVARLGDSGELKIGQWVLAIGNPFRFAIEGNQPTVTFGVISALHRDLPSLGGRSRSYSDLIQTDAAINPGNSGGPLVNLKGEVIGINTAIITTSGGYQGLGFAIPINQAKRILDKLIKGEEILHGWLGISIQNLDENLKEYFNIKENRGVIIVKVFKDSPADKAGLKEGDLILSVDSQDINSTQQLVREITFRQPGTVTTLEILREGRLIRKRVVLGKRPESLEEVRRVVSSSVSFRGMEVEDINFQLKRRYRLGEEEGVVITRIEPNSPAENAGLMVGDIILSIEGQPIRNKEEFLKITKHIKGDCLIKTQRGFFVVKEKVD